MKRIKTTLIFLVAAIMSAVCLCSCGSKGGASETFSGRLSAGEYATKDAAVTAFLEEEIEGRTTHAELVAYVKEADLGTEELAKLPLGDVSADRVTHGERGRVSYRANVVTGDVARTADTADNIETHGLYLLEIDGKTRYLVPPTEVGEPITKSYFEDVFDSEKYVNCTMEGTINMNMAMKMGDETENMNASTKITASITKSGIEYSITMTTKLYGKTTTIISLMYILESDGKLTAYMSEELLGYGPSDSTEWTESDYTELLRSLTGKEIVTLSDFVRFDFGETDYSFFEKTESGFAISSLERYQLMMESRDDSFGDVVDMTSYTITDFSCNYTVKNGRLEKEEAKMTMTDADLGSTVASIIMNYKNFGTTKEVTIPDSLRQYIAAQQSAN